MTTIISGTNNPIAGGVGYGDTTNLLFTPAGTANQVLVSNGTNAPLFTSNLTLTSINTGSFIANSTQVTIPAGIPLSANGSTGQATYVLTSNGSTGAPYWASVSGASTTNVNATFAWTNTQSFSNTITFNGPIRSTNTVNSTSYTIGTIFVANTIALTANGLSVNSSSFTANGLITNSSGAYVTGVVNTAAITGLSNTLTLSGNSSTIATLLTNAAETTNVSATAATGTINYYIASQSVLYYTTAASANWTVNVAFSSGTTLNSALATGQAVSFVFMATQGGTAYYNNTFKIDNVAVTPKWQGGSAPTGGNVSGVDIYTYTIVKTGSSAWSVFASLSQFK
jgi:hypothetical protein